MNTEKNKTYAEQVKMRIRILWAVLLLMLVYMVVFGELISRINSWEHQRLVAAGVDYLAASYQIYDRPHFMERTSSFIFFGVLIYIITRIVHNKKLLKNRPLLLEEQQKKADERRQFLHDKSGGLVVDILLGLLLFATCTAAGTLLFSAAFYLSLGLLGAAILLKIGSYLFYSRYY